jgi:hypothetical protein
MSQNALYAIIGALVLAVIVLGWGWYNEANKAPGVDINLGNNGISIQSN